jgi:hypothetical protein
VAAGTSLQISVPYLETVNLSAVTDIGYTFANWTGTIHSTAASITISSAATETATFVPYVPTFYTITASSDVGSMIIPSGTQTVIQGGNATFSYVSKPGYILSDVIVDGASVPITGSYTFSNVQSVHTISVVSDISTEFTITVSITGGEGYAEYHTADTEYSVFTTVTLPAGTNVYIRAVPADGYEFVNWTGTVSSSDDEIHVDDLEQSLVLVANLRASGSGGNNDLLEEISIIVVVIAAIVAISMLVWLVLIVRRSYEVVKITVEGITINGKDKARRRSAYRFTVDGDDTGIKYRTGDGEWKQPIKTDSGYEIPKGDVTDKLTISSDRT